jgi:hypothetical protein
MYLWSGSMVSIIGYSGRSRGPWTSGGGGHRCGSMAASSGSSGCSCDGLT